MKMEIRKLYENEIDLALDLTWSVFKQFEAPDYSKEGIKEFYNSIHNEEWLAMLELFGAFKKNELIGVIATRNGGSHIALFFVRGDYHKQGIGRRLFERVLQENQVDILTVNSSPFAVLVYQKLGFEDTAPEQVTNGIRYTPMVYKKNTSEFASLISMLEDKDTSAAYKALLELEKISDETGAIYTYIEKFISMINSDKYVIRVLGFRLFCKQARWDRDNILDENIDFALYILNDEKPTAVRQALAALSDIVRYKPDLRETVKKNVTAINYLRYKDTMHSLIAKDIQEVLRLIKEVSEWENIH